MGRILSEDEFFAEIPGDLSVEKSVPKREMTEDEFFGSKPDVEEEPSVFSRSFRSLTAGISNLQASAARVPGFVYGLAAAPQNIVANLTGWNVGAKTPDFLVDNPITRHFEEGAKASSYISEKYAGKDLMSLVKEGDAASVADFIFQSAIESSPTTIALAAASLAGVPSPVSLAGAGALQGANTFTDARNKKLTDLEAATAGLTNGVFEAAFERLGTVGNIEKWGKRIAESVGKKGAKAIFFDTFRNVFGPIFGEATEEGATQLAQDFTNKMYGIEDIPWKDFIGRAIQSATIATVTGSVTAGASQLRALQLNKSAPAEVDQARADTIIQQVEKSKQGVPDTVATDTAVDDTSPVVEASAPAPEVPFSLKPDVAALQEGKKVEAKPTVTEDAPPSGMAEIVGQDDTEIIFDQMDEPAKKTISEFVIGEVDEMGRTLNAEDLDIENLVVEGKPKKEIMDRARYLRDLEQANLEPVLRRKTEAIEAAGKFYLDPKSGIYEELKSAGIPKDFIATREMVKNGEAKSFDDFAQSLRNNVPEIGPDATSSEIIEFLSELNVPKRLPINRFIPDARRQIMGELEGQTFTRVQPGIKKAAEKATGVIRPAEDPTITESQALKAQMQIAEKASKIGFREGKRQEAASERSVKQIIKRRRQVVQIVRDEHGLSDAELRKISNKDIRLMDNYEFKKFIDDIRIKAVQVEKRREAKIAVLSTLHEADFKRVDNLRKFMELPPINKMTEDQLNKFDEALTTFQDGDEFLGLKMLETIDRGELAGSRTMREVREKMAAKAGIKPEMVEQIKISEIDYIKSDTLLAKKNPLLAMIIDSVNSAYLEAAKQTSDFLDEFEPLMKKARESRGANILKDVVPQDKLIVEYLEADKDTLPLVAKKMTNEEIDAADFIRQTLMGPRDYLISNDMMERYITSYFPHIRRGLMEAVKQEGFVKGLLEMKNKSDQDLSDTQIVQQGVLPYEKSFGFSKERKGVIKPSLNVGSVIPRYMESYYRKRAIDKIHPTIMAYALAASPQTDTAEGKKVRAEFISFIKTYLANKMGKRMDMGIVKQGNALDRAIRLLDGFISMKDLGWNLGVGLANQFGDPIANYTAVGKERMALGVKRMMTEKGRAVLKDNKDFVDRSMFEELTSVANDIGDVVHKSMFAMLHAGSVRTNKIFLLGGMTDAEWAEGKISFDRKASLMREMGEYRQIAKLRSIAGSTSVGKLLSKYKGWQYAIIESTVSNLNALKGMVEKDGVASTIKTQEFQKLMRQTLTTGIIYLAVRTLLDDDDDKTFVGRMMRRLTNELLSMYGAFNPVSLTNYRAFEFIKQAGQAFENLRTLEKYKSTGKFKFVDSFSRLLTPGAVRIFFDKDKKPSKPLFKMEQ